MTIPTSPVIFSALCDKASLHSSVPPCHIFLCIKKFNLPLSDIHIIQYCVNIQIPLLWGFSRTSDFTTLMYFLIQRLADMEFSAKIYEIFLDMEFIILYCVNFSRHFCSLNSLYPFFKGYYFHIW